MMMLHSDCTTYNKMCVLLVCVCERVVSLFSNNTIRKLLKCIYKLSNRNAPKEVGIKTIFDARWQHQLYENKTTKRKAIRRK